MNMNYANVPDACSARFKKLCKALDATYVLMACLRSHRCPRVACLEFGRPIMMGMRPEVRMSHSCSDGSAMTGGRPSKVAGR